MRSMVMEQIKKYFGYLFDDYGFDVISETCFESFGNWVVVLRSNDCRLRIVQDRGEVSIAAGPLWSPLGWQAGPWFDLRVITAFLTQGKVMPEYIPGKTDQQLERLSNLLRSYCDQICELFQERVFQQKRAELELYRDQLDEQFWDQLTRKTPG